ncbi:MAG: VOC family protein [Caulobacterales bacterium]|jgi:catechol 2,3-dioxygenase-like lactoylglutathione lyase family enzyme
MPLDHVSIGVSDVARAKAFYDAVLAPLGMTAVMPTRLPSGELVSVGYGDASGKPVFWIGLPLNRGAPSAGNGVHLAFAAPSRAAVDAFYIAAVEHGGHDDGSPGLRSEYHPDYYGAFVRDLDGNKIEAVRHGT